MKTKTIEKVVKAKMTDWLETITDEELRDDIKDGLLVSGGCIASMFLREKVNDYDVYLSDMDLVKRVARYYIKLSNAPVEIFDGRDKDDIILSRFGCRDLSDFVGSTASAIRTLKDDQIKLSMGSHGYGGFIVPEETFEEEAKYVPKFFSPNAISLSNDIQIVIRFYGDHTQVHKSFDFMHATNYFTFNEGLVTNIKALESLLTKTLMYQGSLYPLTSIIRTKKFLLRGFSMSAGEYLKIMYQISTLDLNDLDVLEEQLIGVDVAYFMKLIEILRKLREKKPDFDITPDYLNTIIDRAFGESEGDD